jgi:hypothetical protein
MTAPHAPLDLPAFLAGMGITPRYIALIELSRRRIDAAGHERTRRRYMSRHVRLYQRAMKYREEGNPNA